jgi:hypothetical protein
MGEREAALRVEQEDEGRHHQSIRSMADRLSPVLEHGVMGTRSAREGVRVSATPAPQESGGEAGRESNVIALCCVQGQSRCKARESARGGGQLGSGR